MALFNLRWPGRAAQDDGKRGARQRRAVSTESVDALRRRARHRLIGAAVLLAAGVVGFPLLFDTQPRPIPADIPIAIPERGQAPVLVVPSQPVAAAPAPAAAATPAAAPAPARSPAVASSSAAADSLDKGEEVVASNAARAEKPEKTEKTEKAEKPAAAPAPVRTPPKPAEPVRAEPHREAAAPAKPPAAPAPAAHDDDAARARALLDGKPLPAAAPAAAAPAAIDAGRFVVQVGAFGDAGKAQEARARLTRGGLKTYVQTVDTKDGKRIRVRVGPFASKVEADRAAAKVKGLDLPASILTL